MKALIATVACLVLASAPPSTNAAEPTASDAESAIVRYVVADSVAEVALCRLALTKSQNPAVQSFARQMIADHTRIIDDATALGGTLGVARLERQPSDDGTVSYVHLAQYSGKLFNENFMLANVDDHLTDIETLRHAMEVTKSPSLVRFEAALLPQYETHLRLAQRASDAVAAAS